MERTYRWFVGQEVMGKEVKPYTIAELIGSAGNVHITETTDYHPGGHYHVYWTYPSSSGRNRPVHHGGPEGFDDISRVKRQHLHVIHQLMGTNIELPAHEDHTQPDVLQIPGEIERVAQLGFLAQRAARTLLTAEGVGAYKSAQDDLQEMLGKEGLNRSRTRNKRRAAEIIREGLKGAEPELLGSALGSQTLLLMSERDLVEMTIATLARLGDLETRYLEWRTTVNRLPGQLAQTIKELQAAQGQTEQVGRAMKIIANPNNPRIGVVALLEDLKGEPYYTKAQQMLAKIDQAQKFAATQEYTRLTNILTEQAEQAAIWKSSQREAQGSYQIDLRLALAGRYPATI